MAPLLQPRSKILVFGTSGSGKNTPARKLAMSNDDSLCVSANDFLSLGATTFSRNENADIPLSMEKVALIFSCEHGGYRIPPPFQDLFKNQKKILKSHRGWDPSALPIAKIFAKKLNAPLYFSQTSRLLIDLNRSPHHRQVFSEFSRGLSHHEKQFVFDQHYTPYRQQVENRIKHLLKSHKRVFHISVHSFTPVLNGEVRNCEIGLLYDPRRKIEKDLASRLSSHLKHSAPHLRVRKNYPYNGAADGFTTHLRKVFSKSRYCGLEIEFNQKLFTRGQHGFHLQRFCHSIHAAIEHSVLSV